MKAPGQTQGEISDDNVETVDVLPTIADRLGFDLPFRSDGRVAGGDDPRDPDLKDYDDVDANALRAEDGEPRLQVEAQPGLDALMRADPVDGTGEEAAWKRTEHGDLLGRPVSELTTGSAGGGTVHLDDLGRFGDIDLDRPLPIEALGRTDEPTGSTIAFALNGTIAAVTEAGVTAGDGQVAHALLLPRLFADGANELSAFLVEGPVGSETLRPLELDGSG
jgi:hypothetical protein